MPIPEPLGTSRGGCFKCGAKSTMQIAIQAHHLGEKGVRLSGGAVSRSRSLCRSCADELWDEMAQHLEPRR